MKIEFASKKRAKPCNARRLEILRYNLPTKFDHVHQIVNASDITTSACCPPRTLLRYTSIEL
jgi:hypothetical protein